MSEQQTKIYTVSELLAGQSAVDTNVIVKGWVRTRRDSKAGISFVNLSDGSCFSNIQVVVPNTLSNYENEVLHLTAGCSIEAEGKLVASPGKAQDYEIHADQITVIGWVENPDTYPISPKHHTLEYLREYAHLRPRTNIIGAATRVQDCLAQAIFRFFHERHYFWVHTPIITTNDCEGAGEMFRVSTLDLLNLPRKDDGAIDFAQDFFGGEAFLSVSGQLHAEAHCLALSRVFTFGPTFRAENSNTSRHLAEFWMLEPEVAFADLIDIENLAEKLLKYCAKAVLDERYDDLSFFTEHVDKECIPRLEKLLDSKFQRIEYTEAIDALLKSNKKFEFPVKWGLDLQSEHERYLCEELINGPVAVVNYPKEIKSFYMRQNDDGKTVAAMDVLAPGFGEIMGGSQREERLDVLEKRMKELNMDLDIYSWYLDLRRYGTVPHAGFGMGFERFVGYVTGMSNIRDIIPFPRTAGHATY